MSESRSPSPRTTYSTLRAASHVCPSYPRSFPCPALEAYKGEARFDSKLSLFFWADRRRLRSFFRRSSRSNWETASRGSPNCATRTKEITRLFDFVSLPSSLPRARVDVNVTASCQCIAHKKEKEAAPRKKKVE